MAIEFVDVTVGSKTKKGLVVGNEGGVDQVILQESLDGVDVRFLNIVDAAEGETIAEKLEATVLPNGIKASDFFASRVVGVDVLTNRQKRQDVSRDIVGAIVALQDGVTDGGDEGTGGDEDGGEDGGEVEE